MTYLNQVLKRNPKKPILYDLFYIKNNQPKPLVIFCHGYKGFKDWGAWNLVAKEFMSSNCFFVKFNFSHNGGTIEQPIDFPDLEAFAENNYSKELDDLKAILDFVLDESREFSNEIDVSQVVLIGHSRGGGITCINAFEDYRVTKLITWASVSDFEKRSSTSGDLESWRNNGVKYVLNSRTNQKMPHNFQFYLDFMANEERLNIKNAVSHLNKPHLIIHSRDDKSVQFSEAEELYLWSSKGTFLPIENSDHVFSVKHPWKETYLPNTLENVVQASLKFIHKKT